MPGHSLGTADPDTVAEAVACNVQATTKTAENWIRIIGFLQLFGIQRH